jgi:hypothetical protein
MQRWNDLADEARAGRLSVLELEFLFRCGPPRPDPPEPEVIEAARILRQRLERERGWYGELSAWSQFCAVAAQQLGRTARDGENVETHVHNGLSVARWALEQFEGAATLATMLGRVQ